MAIPDPLRPGVYRFADTLATPDPFYADDYASNYRGEETAIVIDNGSSQCRVGWASETSPHLVFRNAIAKTRGKRGESDCTCIGNNITNVEAVRSSLRNQFDRNIVVNFACQEQILDYAFSHLGLFEESSIDHPLVMTEPVCNPSYCRSTMSELLFEGYGVPSVSYGVDGLFGAYHHARERGVALGDALIISSGHQATHVMPVVGGKFDARNCKRINIGGAQVVGYMQRLLQLKYPALLGHITLSRALEITTNHCYVALNYSTELAAACAMGDEGFRVIQLPFTQGAVLSDTLAKEEKDKIRKQKAREQLLKLNQRKREERIAELQADVERLANLQQLQDELDADEFLGVLEESELYSVESLEQAIKTAQQSLLDEQNKLSSIQRDGEQSTEPEMVSEDWLQSLRLRRKELIEQIKSRQQQRQELSKRRSAASTHRMRIISRLAEGEAAAGKKSRKKEDTFGMDDDDWNVYRTISKHAGESDGEKDEAELSEISKLLEKHDPAFMKLSTGMSVQVPDTASYYQLHLGIERFRVPEIVFQPMMVGVDQSGVTETLDFVLHKYSPDVQQRLVNNVVVTGGNTAFPHFIERLRADLQSVRPFQSTFTVHDTVDPLLDAWRGAATWATESSNKKYYISRSDYSEMGSDFFREHVTTNLRVSPQAKDMDEM
ncbi:hypothetical protein EMCRGX_G031967 [Ephydatia muelleri]